mgnify:CR=1 FL=1
MIKWISTAITVVAVAAHAPATLAQTARVVVGYPAGGASDIVTRVIADKLREGLNEPFIAENKPGALLSLSCPLPA